MMHLVGLSIYTHTLRSKKTIGIFMVFFIVVGSLTMAGSIAKDVLIGKYQPQGHMVDVDGHKLHILSEGEGSPTVVMEAGAGDFSLTWTYIQREVAEYTQVCVYDRAGLGWSEPSPKPRTAQTIVEELHELLTNDGIEGPYVLVGHSMGGLYMRLYAHEYPDEVVGMVLIEATPEETESYPEAYLHHINSESKRQIRLLGYAKLLNTVGLLALFDIYPDQYLPELPQPVKEMYKGVILSGTDYFEACRKELASHTESRAQLQSANITTLGDMPIVILIRGSHDISGFDLPTDVIQQYKSTWYEQQTGYTTLSPNSKIIIASQSGHNVHHDQPELVIEAIRQVVEAVRGG